MDMNVVSQKCGSFRWKRYLPILFCLSCTPILFHFHYPLDSHLCDVLLEGCCLFIALIGFMIRALAIGYIPREKTGKLATKGIYSLLRHPLCVGNFFLGLAPVLFLHSWWLSLLYVIFFILYYQEVIQKETILLDQQFGVEYRNWVEEVPAFFPQKLRWQHPDVSFSWKTVLRYEYVRFLILIAIMTAIEHIGDVVIHHAFVIDAAWTLIFLFSTSLVLFVYSLPGLFCCGMIVLLIFIGFSRRTSGQYPFGQTAYSVGETQSLTFEQHVPYRSMQLQQYFPTRQITNSLQQSQQYFFTQQSIRPSQQNDFVTNSLFLMPQVNGIYEPRYDSYDSVQVDWFQNPPLSHKSESLTGLFFPGIFNASKECTHLDDSQLLITSREWVSVTNPNVTAIRNPLSSQSPKWDFSFPGFHSLNRNRPPIVEMNRFNLSETYATGCSRRSKFEWFKIRSDFRNFYSSENLANVLVAGYGMHAIVSNTSLDQNLTDWYQNHIRSNILNECSAGVRDMGANWAIAPVVAVSFLYYSDRITDRIRFFEMPTGSVLGEFASRTTRGYLVGTPTMLVSQMMIGADRPNDFSHSSHWAPFQYNHGVSGHAFVGAMPFITLAQMSDNFWLKTGFYTCSTFTAWSRFNDDKHYFSQCALGWYLAYLSCRAVSRTEYQLLPRGMNVFPVIDSQMTGIGLIYQW